MLSHFEQLCQTIARLRGPEGCPWDREQTYKSLTRYLIEETHEVLEAINAHEFGKLKGELGDLLLQIVLQAQLATEDGYFNIDDVAKAINEKMVSRHPHVFAGEKLSTSEEVLKQWEELKRAEQLAKENDINSIESGVASDAPDNTNKTSALANVPVTLPALLKALKISEKAVNQGFEWEKEEDIWQQLNNEIEEFKQEATKQSNPGANGILPSGDHLLRRSSVAHEDLYLEMGDILFTIVNIARWYRIDPEEALLMTIDKFKKRFALMENNTKQPLKELTPKQLNKLWQQAKRELKNSVE